MSKSANWYAIQIKYSIKEKNINNKLIKKLISKLNLKLNLKLKIIRKLN